MYLFAVYRTLDQRSQALFREKTSPPVPHGKLETVCVYRGLKEKKAPQALFSKFVAGPRIELGSGGYEPPEVPLLYPAIPI